MRCRGRYQASEHRGPLSLVGVAAAGVYRLGKASVADVVEHIPSPPTRDAVRRMCHILEEKGLLRSRAEGTRRIYFPTVNLRRARRSAEDNIVETFFGGSPYMLVAALLDARRDELSDADVTRLTEMIDSAEKARKGRKARG